MKKVKMAVCLGLVLVLICLGFYACGGSKTSEAKALLEKQVTLMENFTAAMEKAGTAQEMAAALNDFGAGMKELTPQMMELSKKYASLYKESPEDLKPLTKRIEELTPKMTAAFMKSVQFASDPAVQEAQKKFSESMAQPK